MRNIDLVFRVAKTLVYSCAACLHQPGPDSVDPA
jgi:hypothetical protein